MEGEDQDGRSRVSADDFAGCLQTVHLWHLEIHHGDVGNDRGEFLKRFFAIFGFATDLPGWARFKHAAQDLSNWFVVVDKENAEQGSTNQLSRAVLHRKRAKLVRQYDKSVNGSRKTVENLRFEAYWTDQGFRRRAGTLALNGYSKTLLPIQ